VKSKFSNPAFALVYLGQEEGERSLCNLLKKIRDNNSYTKSIGAIFFMDFRYLDRFLEMCIHYTKSDGDALVDNQTFMVI
jgi:hypothetical protein